MKRMLSVVLALVATLTVHAATFTVDTFSDETDENPLDGICEGWSGNCSLRAAIMQANYLAGADTIIVPPGTYTLWEGPGEDLAESGDLDIWESLTIIGANGNPDGDPSATIIQARTTSDTYGDRIFHVVDALPATRVTIQAMTLRNAYSPALFDSGGAIASQSSEALTLYNLVIEQSRVRYGDGGALAFGSTGTVTIEKTVIRENESNFGEGGAILIAASAVTIRDSVISGNRAPEGNGGAIRVASGSLTIERSLIAGNFANEGGGAIYSAGSAPITISDSTFSGNSATLNGGAVAMTAGSLTAANVTFAGNISNGGAGGGIANSGGTVLLTNSILANDPSPFGTAPDISGTVSAASSNNIIASSSSGGLTHGVNGNQVGVDPRVGPLADNGGPTQTHALLAGSPAIEAGTNSAASSQDQRGRPRVLDSADPDATQTVDIGAFEAHPTISDIPNAPSALFSGVQYDFPFHVGDASLGLMLTATSSNQSVVSNASLSFANSSTDNPVLALTGAASGTATITVTVSSATGSVSDSFDVWIEAVPDLTIAKAAPSSLYAGQTGARYVITVSNAGAAPAMGEVVVTDVPPPGMIVTSMSGVGWTCDTTTCRRADLLAPGASWPSITGVVSIDPSAAGALTNVATVGGGGDLSVGNNSAGATSFVHSFTFTPDTLPPAQFGTSYAEQISVTASVPPPYTISISGGALPLGLALTGDQLSGIPTEAGEFAFTVQALYTDSDGREFAGWKTYTLTVAPPVITLAPAALPDASFGVAYNELLTASGGTMPYGFAITAGALPDGLDLDPSGTLSGMAAQAGTFSFTVTATDSTARSGPFTGSHAYTLEVAKAASAIAIATPSITYGDTASVTVTVSSPAAGTPGGSVTLTVDGTTSLTQTISGGATTFSLPSLTGGSHTLAASYTGDSNYLASSDAATLEVNRAVPTITIDAPSIVFGSDATITVAVPNATGTIDLMIDGATHAQTLVAGIASFTIPALEAGTYPLTATYSGDANYESGTMAGTLEVAKAVPTVHIDAPSIVFGNAATITVTVPNATGTIELTIDGATQTQTLVSGLATVTIDGLDAGTYPLAAMYSGEANYESGTATATLDVTRASSVITITSVSPSPSIAGDSVTVSFTVTGDDADVTVSAGAYGCTALASTGSCTITFDAVGAYELVASYPGAANYEPSASAPFTHVVEHPIGNAVVSGDATICAGDEVTLLVELTGTAPWTLTWSDGIVETATATPHPRTLAVDASTVFTLTAASDAHRAMTIAGSAQIAVRDPLAAPTIEGPVSVVLGESFRLEASRGYDSHQWYRNGRALANATSRRLVIETADAGDIASYTVVGFVDGCISPRSPEFVVNEADFEALIATVVGSTDGANGSRFRSALHLFNRSDSAFDGALSFVNASAGGGAAATVLALLPLETRWYGDLFGGSGLASADLAILRGDAPLGLVHVYNDLGENGTTGLLQPLVDASRTLAVRDRAVLIAPADPVATRFNIGIRTLRRGASLRYTVRDAAGLIRATADHSFPPSHFAHMSAAQFTGVEPGSSDSIEIELTGGTAIVYGASTDNITNDPNIQFARRVTASDDVRRVIPVVGSTAGAFGSRFRTSLQLFNSDDETRSATVTVRPHGVTQTFTIESKATLAIGDLLPAMGLEGIGTADLVSNPAIAAVVRVFNDGEGETSMTEELVDEEQVLEDGEAATVLAPHDPSVARFNIGIRAFESGATLLVTVRSPQGVVLATRELVLGPHHFQHTSAFDATGHAFTGDESITFSVTSGRAVAYGVWTDNITNDPGFHVAR